MIKLMTGEYCDDCPNFNPTCDTSFDKRGNPEHYITCYNSEECRHIFRYIKYKMKEKDDDNAEN